MPKVKGSPSLVITSVTCPHRSPLSPPTFFMIRFPLFIIHLAWYPLQSFLHFGPLDLFYTHGRNYSHSNSLATTLGTDANIILQTQHEGLPKMCQSLLWQSDLVNGNKLWQLQPKYWPMNQYVEQLSPKSFQFCPAKDRWVRFCVADVTLPCRCHSKVKADLIIISIL